MALHQTCQLTLWNFISQGCYIVNTKYMLCGELLYHCNCNIYACWPSVTATETDQTFILIECCCNIDACWTVATQSACLPTFFHSILPHILLVWCLIISRACWCGVLLWAMQSGVVPHYQLCLLVCGFIIGHDFWCGISLSALTVYVVPHYRPYLLVWCLTLGNAFWCGASLWAMPSGVVPHYRPWRFAWYLTIGHVCWSVATATNILLVECRWKKYGYNSAATLTEVPLHQTSSDHVSLSDMPACTVNSILH